MPVEDEEIVIPEIPLREILGVTSLPCENVHAVFDRLESMDIRSAIHENRIIFVKEDRAKVESVITDLS